MTAPTWKTTPQREKNGSARFHGELAVMYLTISGMTHEADSARMGVKSAEFAREVRGPWYLLTDLRSFEIARPEGRELWIENMRLAAKGGMAAWAVVGLPGVASLQSRNVSKVSELDAITLFTESFEEADAWLRAAARATRAEVAPAS